MVHVDARMGRKRRRQEGPVAGRLPHVAPGAMLVFAGDHKGAVGGSLFSIRASFDNNVGRHSCLRKQGRHSEPRTRPNLLRREGLYYVSRAAEVLADSVLPFSKRATTAFRSSMAAFHSPTASVASSSSGGGSSAFSGDASLSYLRRPVL